MISKSVTRRTLLKSGTAVAAIGLASPFIISSARAKADHTLTFGHTFGKATEDVMITGLGLFKKKAEEYAGGKLLVDIHEDGSLGGQTVLPNKVLTGAIQGCLSRMSKIFWTSPTCSRAPIFSRACWDPMPSPSANS